MRSAAVLRRTSECTVLVFRVENSKQMELWVETCERQIDANANNKKILFTPLPEGLPPPVLDTVSDLKAFSKTTRLHIKPILRFLVDGRI